MADAIKSERLSCDIIVCVCHHCSRKVPSEAGRFLSAGAAGCTDEPSSVGGTAHSTGWGAFCRQQLEGRTERWRSSQTLWPPPRGWPCAPATSCTPSTLQPGVACSDGGPHDQMPVMRTSSSGRCRGSDATAEAGLEHSLRRVEGPQYHVHDCVPHLCRRAGTWRRRSIAGSKKDAPSEKCCASTRTGSGSGLG